MAFVLWQTPRDRRLYLIKNAGGIMPNVYIEARPKWRSEGTPAARLWTVAGWSRLSVSRASLQSPCHQATGRIGFPPAKEGSPVMERAPQPRRDVSYTLLIIAIGVAIVVLFFTVLR